jgi:transcription antitermination protein NusB
MRDDPRMPSEPSSRTLSSQRSVARKLAMQALYRWQLNDCPWQDLVQEFRDAEDMPRADGEYFRELVEGVWRDREALDAELSSWADRGPALLDPIEHAVLLIGIYELRHRQDVPYRVAISEAVALAKRFGATDGHKYVNAVLDRAARALRPNEH